MSTLLLKFDPPMQSWGTELKLKDHPTDRYPSKSGVIGLVASAQGRRRDADVSDLAALKFGVRIDEQGTIINDFQVSHFDEDNAKIGHREYLSDAVFTCGIEGDPKKLEEIRDALLHPAYPLFAGRRGCPVTAELVQDIVPEDLLSALTKNDEDKTKSIIMDTDDADGIAIKDVPISFSPFNRQYRYRFVKKL